MSEQRFAELEEEFYEEWHPAHGTNMQDMLVRKVIQLEEENAALKIRTGVCEWKYDEHRDVWETSCSNAWQFITDGPKENDCQYCMYCGGAIDALLANTLEAK